MNLLVQLLHSAARLPLRAHPDDAGADLFAVEAVTIPAGERRDVGTGIALGSGLGLLAGVLFGNIAIGLVFGTLIGIVVGSTQTREG